MRKLVVAFAAIVLLVLPSGVAAHTSYLNTTLDNESTYTGTLIVDNIGNPNWPHVNCGATYDVPPDSTRYLVPGDGAIGDTFSQTWYRHWSFATHQNWHWHAADNYVDTGFATAQVDATAFNDAYGGVSFPIGTRRIHGDSPSDFASYVIALKVVNHALPWYAYAHVKLVCP